MRMLTTFALSGLCLLAIGCEVKYTEPAHPAVAQSAKEREFEAVWQASKDVLRDHHFQLDRQDRRAGVITTLPMTGAYILEPWRQDAVRPNDLAEGTVQTVIRTARVRVRPGEGAGALYTVDVDVLIERTNRPQPEVTSTSEAYALFGENAFERRARAREAGGGAFLTDLGHDRSLEARLTEEIAAAVGRPAVASPPDGPEPVVETSSEPQPEPAPEPEPEPAPQPEPQPEPEPATEAPEKPRVYRPEPYRGEAD